MPFRTKPHSADWFKAFHRINPVQADLTKRLVKRAGHGNICSTCGDPPHGDFLMQIFPFFTLRLCEPCLEIYTRTYGDRIVPAEDLADSMGEKTAAR